MNLPIPSASLHSHSLGCSGEPILPAFRSFPVECFPSSVRRYVSSVAAAQDCDPAFVALPVLSTLAAAVGNSHRLAIKKSWSEPANLWTALLSDGRTNTRSVMDAASVSRDLRRPLVRDGRLNAIVPLLEREPRGLLLRLDQLDGWLGRPNSSAARRLAEVSQWVDVHRGLPVSMEKRLRQIDVPFPSISLLGTVQSQVLSDKFLKARQPCELTSRLLFAAPPSRPMRWTNDDVSVEVSRDYVDTVLAMSKTIGVTEELTDDFGAGVLDRLSEPPLRSSGPGHPTHDLELDKTPGPVEVQLSPEAKSLFAQFVDWVGHELLDVDELLIPWYAQLTSHAARLALVVHLTRCAQGDVTDRLACDATSMQAGITMARWFAQEARRVIALFSVAHDNQEQGRIIDWLHRRGGMATSRDLCRSNGRRYPTDDEARLALDRLADRGVGAWIDFPPSKNGGPGYRAFSLSRTYFEGLPELTDIVPVAKVAEKDRPASADSIVNPGPRPVPSDRSGEIGATESQVEKLLAAPIPCSRLASCVGQKCEQRRQKKAERQNRRKNRARR